MDVYSYSYFPSNNGKWNVWSDSTAHAFIDDGRIAYKDNDHLAKLHPNKHMDADVHAVGKVVDIHSNNLHAHSIHDANKDGQWVGNVGGVIAYAKDDIDTATLSLGDT